MKVRYVSIIPASNDVKIGESLNILGLVENLTNEMVVLCIKLWGKSERDWMCLTSQDVKMEAKEHKHLYFNIPKECTIPSRWEQSELEEIELVLSHEKPADYSVGKMIFVIQ